MRWGIHHSQYRPDLCEPSKQGPNRYGYERSKEEAEEELEAWKAGMLAERAEIEAAKASKVDSGGKVEEKISFALPKPKPAPQSKWPKSSRKRSLEGDAAEPERKMVKLDT